MWDIRLHGRGGQGAVVASKILADAYFRQGFQVQAFPAFGMERRGAPVAAFVRVDREPILQRGQIQKPGIVIVFDSALLQMVDITDGLRNGGQILINHSCMPAESGFYDSFSVATVDASAIALKYKLGSVLSPIVNTVILGAYARIRPELELENILVAIEEGVPFKPEENKSAAKEAYDHVKTRDIQ